VRDNMGHANIDVTQNVYGLELVGSASRCGHPSCRSRKPMPLKTREREKRISLSWLLSLKVLRLTSVDAFERITVNQEGSR